MLNHKGVTIRKRTNKDRSTGKRGEKQRYSLWKAVNNQKWEQCKKEHLYWCCVKFDLDPDTFINRDDNPRVIWDNAMKRFSKYLRDNNYFEHTDRGNKRKQVERLRSFDSFCKMKEKEKE